MKRFSFGAIDNCLGNASPERKRTVPAKILGKARSFGVSPPSMDELDALDKAIRRGHESNPVAVCEGTLCGTKHAAPAHPFCAR
jgi:hypothetical protein